MMQEVIDRVNQLGTADGQPKLLTFFFCDCKGHLIRETETPGVPDTVNAAVPDDEDVVKDLNPPTVNNDNGPGQTQDTD